jgi:hypothetical protein
LKDDKPAGGNKSSFPPAIQGYAMCFSQPEIADIVIFFRLSLYNHAKPCSAKAIHYEMQSARITPLPSIASIHRILVQQNLTHRRTGRYPGEHENRL